VTAVLAGARFQWWWMRGRLDQTQAFVMTPLFTILFCAIAKSGGRADLFPRTVLGAALVGLWMVCVQLGGEIIEIERASGTFEPLVSTRSPLSLVVAGRTSVVVAVAGIVFPEAWLTAWAVFGLTVPVHHPQLLVGALLLTLAGLHGAVTLFAAVFVLARQALILQNAVTYPFYLLGGLVVPVSALPEWAQPVSRLVFLSWSSDAMQAALLPATPPLTSTLPGLAVTALATLVAGQLALALVVRRACRQGTLSL
jgi:ABC-2 type transport system permease protein